jgi:hypothetical protein
MNNWWRSDVAELQCIFFLFFFFLTDTSNNVLDWIDRQGFLAGCTARARLDYRVWFTVSKFGIILVRWHYQPRRILYNVRCFVRDPHVLSPSLPLEMIEDLEWRGGRSGKERFWVD